MRAPILDNAGAFCPGGLFDLPATAHGPLSGLGFAAKDLYDVEGRTTGAGSPAWLSSHEPASRSASAIEALRAAGADLRGKTLTDELAYSINGDNHHYGTPLNTKAPSRFPGGSSSGSAAAVAAGSVDFALGTDSGGSNRIPASFCGLIGIRTTHGRIARDGLVPLMPSFDTVGWFARDVRVFEKVGAVLLGPEKRREFSDVVLLDDALEQCWPAAQAAVHAALDRIALSAGQVRRIRISGEGLEQWRQWYRVFSAAQTWTTHGDWIRRTRPMFSPAIRDRFAFAASVTADEAASAKAQLDRLRQRIRDQLGDSTLMVAPTAPGMAPLLEASDAEIEDFRQRAQRLTCIAGIGGLAELSIPLVHGLDAPMNLSLIGAPGTDLSLIRYAKGLLRAR
jgi:amidase